MKKKLPFGFGHSLSSREMLLAQGIIVAATFNAKKNLVTGTSMSENKIEDSKKISESEKK